MEGIKNGRLVEGSVPEEVMNLLTAIASGWGDTIDSACLKVRRVNGGLSNRVYVVSWPTKTGNSPRSVIVRIYGGEFDHYLDRDREIQVLESLSVHGHGPKFLGRFSGGRIEEFVHARTLSAPDIRDPTISSLIAAKLREFHKLDIPGLKSAILWEKLRKFLKEAKNLCSSQHGEEFQLDKLEDEIVFLEEFTGSHQKMGFCHNDVQYSNIMFNDKTQSITIIDYEFAGYNPVAYEIANFFSGMTANFHSDTPHVLDYSKYPGLEERQRFIREYLCHTEEHEPSECDVDKFVEDVEKYNLAENIFWGLWAIISGYAKEEEYEYRVIYAKQRLDEYWLRKNEMLKGKEEW